MTIPKILRGRPEAGALAGPVMAVVLAAFVLPMVAIVWLGVSTPHLGLQTYRDLLADDVTIRVLLRTLRMAAVVTLVTLLLGYPYAYAMTVASPLVRSVLVAR